MTAPSVPTILEKIAAERRAEVAEQRRVLSDSALWEMAIMAGVEPGRFARALARPGLSLIAEVKRASPSRGIIAEIPDPAALATAYVDGGARAISVLTEPLHFRGDPDDLHAVATANVAPVLRKDFLVEPRQVAEAVMWGASACLLIVALLPTRAELGPMLRACTRARLDALVEVHDARELDVALESGARIVGVNARNLHDFTLDPGLFAALRPRIPDDVLAVAESGIHSHDDVRRALDAGADAILVGERLAASPDPAAAVRQLLRGTA